MLPKALQHPKEVVEGWVNIAKMEFNTLPEDQVEVIVRRRLICSECPFMSENAKKLSNYKSSREDKHCILCSCPIISKTASLDSICGAKYYNDTHVDKPQLEVKWHSYESPTSNER